MSMEYGFRNRHESSSQPDIVERLRQWDDPHGVKREAADEIERLRQRVAELEAKREQVAVATAEREDGLRQRVKELEKDFKDCHEDYQSISKELHKKAQELATCEKERTDQCFECLNLSNAHLEVMALKKSLTNEQKLHAVTLAECAARGKRIDELEATCEDQRKLYANCTKIAQRCDELEACIKSHGIPVKTYSGGIAHYCKRETLLDAHARQVEAEDET